MLDNFNWLVLPESLTREVRGRGLLAWAEENIGVHLREPSGSDAIKVGVYGWGKGCEGTSQTGQGVGLILAGDAMSVS